MMERQIGHKGIVMEIIRIMTRTDALIESKEPERARGRERERERERGVK